MESRVAENAVAWLCRINKYIVVAGMRGPNTSAHARVALRPTAYRKARPQRARCTPPRPHTLWRSAQRTACTPQPASRLVHRRRHTQRQSWTRTTVGGECGNNAPLRLISPRHHSTCTPEQPTEQSPVQPAEPGHPRENHAPAADTTVRDPRLKLRVARVRPCRIEFASLELMPWRRQRTVAETGLPALGCPRLDEGPC